MRLLDPQITHAYHCDGPLARGESPGHDGAFHKSLSSCSDERLFHLKMAKSRNKPPLWLGAIIANNRSPLQ